MTQLLGIGSEIVTEEGGQEGVVTGFSVTREGDKLIPQVITKLTDGTRLVISGATIEEALGKDTASTCQQTCDQSKPKARAK